MNWVDRNNFKFYDKQAIVANMQKTNVMNVFIMRIDTTQLICLQWIVYKFSVYLNETFSGATKLNKHNHIHLNQLATFFIFLQYFL